MLPACAREWSTEHAEAQMAAISDLHCRIVWCSTNPGRNQKHAVSHGQSSMLEVQLVNQAIGYLQSGRHNTTQHAHMP